MKEYHITSEEIDIKLKSMQEQSYEFSGSNSDLLSDLLSDASSTELTEDDATFLDNDDSNDESQMDLADSVTPESPVY